VKPLLLVICLAAMLALASPAGAARYAIGLEPGASAERVGERVAAAAGTRVGRGLEEMRVLTFTSNRKPRVLRIPGVAWVERLDRPRRHPAFTPNDPLLARQWYLEQTRAFDTWKDQLTPPPLASVRVAVIDSGIDANHPEFQGQIADGRSFVGGDWRIDRQGHGTFVAGLIAARTDNGEGIAGMAFRAELLVAKVVRSDRTISLEAEARAIRWAVDEGAQVINLSLGGLRDPLKPARDTFSPLEAAAVAYAYAKGAVVVAAVGNSDQAPRKPWPFASYPSALPHVIGVSALTKDGAVPMFSDRDRIFNDLAAPGQDIVSTLPRALTASQPSCKAQGYSDCGPDEYRRAEGTSFAAPQVTAAAALLLGVDASLTPDQVMHLLTRTAVDANSSTGCRKCPIGRDRYSGWGRLDVTNAIADTVARNRPLPDRFETNDEAGTSARRMYGSRGNALTATVDFWDDQTDVYQVRLSPGQRLWVSLRGPSGTRVFLWTPGTSRVEGFVPDVQRRRVAQSVRRGTVERFGYRAPPRVGGGWYYLQVKIGSPGSGAYTLSWSKR
jgi:hypothetical protein